MGGSIKVVVKIDEHVFLTDTHTNGLPYFVLDSRFFESNREYVKSFMDNWSFIEHKKQNAETFAPYGYGLDVYDFDSRKIYTMQSYCGYEQRHSASYLVDTQEDKEQLDVYKNLWNKKYMGLRCIKDKYSENLHSSENSILYTVDNLSIDEASKIVLTELDNRNSKQKGYTYFEMLWQNAGWTVQKYSESYLGAKSFFETLYNNYSLTEKDIMCWHNNLESIVIE